MLASSPTPSASGVSSKLVTSSFTMPAVPGKFRFRGSSLPACMCRCYTSGPALLGATFTPPSQKNSRISTTSREGFSWQSWRLSPLIMSRLYFAHEYSNHMFWLDVADLTWNLTVSFRLWVVSGSTHKENGSITPPTSPFCRFSHSSPTRHAIPVMSWMLDSPSARPSSLLGWQGWCILHSLSTPLPTPTLCRWTGLMSLISPSLAVWPKIVCCSSRMRISWRPWSSAWQWRWTSVLLEWTQVLRDFSPNFQIFNLLKFYLNSSNS